MRVLAFVALLLLGPTCSLAEDTLTFGMAPTMGTLEMENVFGRLARKIDDALPQTVVFRTRDSRQAFNTAFNNGEFDLVIMHPFDFLRSDVQQQFVPVVRKKGDLQPVFVVLNEDIQSMDDLFGKKVGFPSSGGFVHQLGKALLQRHGMQDGDYQYIAHGNFAACLQSVVNGLSDACLSIRNLVKEYSRNNTLEFRVIGDTDPIPHVVLFARQVIAPHLPNLQAQLLALNDTEDGRILLNLLLLDELEAIDSEQVQQMRSHLYFSQQN